MSKFKVGDTVCFTSKCGAYVKQDDVYIYLTEDDIGTITSIGTTTSISDNRTPAWPFSVTVQDKPVHCWDDKAWHLKEEEIYHIN